MNKLLRPFLALCLTTMAGVAALTLAPAQGQQRAYAPEDLRALAYNDQVRVISLEYSEQSRGRRIPDDQLRFYIDQINRSNWGFSQVKADIAQSLGGGSPQPVPGQTVRCESLDGRANICRTPWSGPSRLVRQLSNSPCDEGRTWQSQQGQVYVGNGCRAEFTAAPVAPVAPLPTAGYRLTCSSVDGRTVTCPWPPRYGRPYLVRQLSNAACTEGHSWGWRAPVSLWVSRGCRGEFADSGHPGSGPVHPGYSATCTSHAESRTYCAWDARQGRPYLIQQLSRPQCIENATWGYDRQQLWVRDGCDGRFGAR